MVDKRSSWKEGFVAKATRATCSTERNRRLESEFGTLARKSTGIEDIWTVLCPNKPHKQYHVVSGCL